MMDVNKEKIQNDNNFIKPLYNSLILSESNDS